MRRWPVGLVLWLLLLACVEVVVFVVIAHLFVQSRHGQLLDTMALTGNRIGQTRIQGPVDTILNALSVASLAIATAVIGFIALIRRRVALAVGAIVLIVGANLTSQLLKHVLSRPELGVDVARAAAGNSLPSGHTTIAASVAVAVVLVLPAWARGTGAVLGACFAAIVGVATLSAGWHRPSDAVAALAVVGGWASLAAVFIVLAQRRHGGVDYGPANRFVVLMLTVAGLALLVGAAVALKLTDQVLATPPDEVSRPHLFIAYAGGAVGIAGAAALLLASVLVAVHRVVPRAMAPSTPAEPAPAAVAS